MLGKRNNHSLTSALSISATIFIALLALLLHTKSMGLVSASHTSEATIQSSRSPGRTQKHTLKLRRHKPTCSAYNKSIKILTSKTFQAHYSLLNAMPGLAAADESTFVPLRNVPGGKCPVSTVEELCVLFVFSPLDFPPSRSLVGSASVIQPESRMRSNFPAAQHNKMLQTENGISLILAGLFCFWFGQSRCSRDSMLADKKVNDLLL